MSTNEKLDKLIELQKQTLAVVVAAFAVQTVPYIIMCLVT